MADFQWTEAQKEAIRTVDRDILLTASAGAGKTAVLAQRCLFLLTDAPKRCDIDELLVLTFTEAAAAETAPASGDAEMASAEHMKPDAHPSKDTATEGNAPTEGDLGKNADPAGNPTYVVAPDGKVDWYAWRGYKKYMANCMQCHGPDGMGSSFAPNLAESLQDLTYYDYAGIVVGGQQNKWSAGNSIMPAWGEDPNVMCSLDSIYIYLRGRADGTIGRGEPKRIANNKEAQQEEYDCLGF